MRSNLAIELGRPAARDRGFAARASAFGSQAVLFDQVAAAADQRFAALQAARVFPLANAPRQVASVDVAQASFAANFRGAQQVFDVGIALTASLIIALHFVIAVKCGDVPWNVGRDACKKFGEAAQFIVIVVEAGNQQRNNLEPQSALMNAANAVENGGDASAEFVVVAIIEALQVDFVQVEPGT